MAIDGAWMCRACWKTNRPQDSRCYRCHTPRNADQATIDSRRGMAGAPPAKDDARGVLEVLVALPAVVFSWFWRLMALGGILFLLVATLAALSTGGGLLALVAVGFATLSFLVAIAMRWAAQEMRAGSPWGFVVGLVLSLAMAGVELWGLRTLPRGTGNPVWEALGIIVIFGVAAILAAFGLVFSRAQSGQPKRS